MPLPIAVLVSGSGSNLQSIIDKSSAGVLDAEVRLVVSNRPDAFGLERAKKHGIAQAVIEHTAYPDRQAFDAEMARVIEASGAQVVALAGFMRMLSPWFVQRFAGRLLNIHPALLPSFPGTHGQRDAAAYGVKISGCTVHFVDEQMDHGPIIIQAAVEALPGEGADALGQRILSIEHRIYPQAIQWLATGRLRIEGRHVFLEKAGLPKANLWVNSPCLVNPPLEDGF
jgi:phosphoribosylglycinamide formyltransferase-1